MKDERTYLLHAIEAIDAILNYTRDGRDAFLADRKTQDAVIRNIEIIGQAVKGISGTTCALDAEVPWRQIAGMRDKLILSTSASTSPSFGMWSSAICQSLARGWRNWRQALRVMQALKPSRRRRAPSA